MDDRETGVRIFDPCASAAAAYDHEQPTIDLLAPVHARGVLLPDKAALGKADAVQFDRIAFEPKHVAEFGEAFGDAEAEAVFEPARRRLVGRPEPAPTEIR